MSDIRRDRYGRPYVIPPDGGPATPYTRATTLAETLDDRYNLELWKMRQVALGLAARPDLLALAGAKAADKQALNKVCEDACEAAEAGAAANLGTALHAFTEDIDRDLEPFGVPAALKVDLDAYRAATADYTMLAVECFVVCDELKVAGTFDRLMTCPDGKIRIGDLKTGAGAVTYGQTSIAVQLAVYAHGMLYEDGQRSPLDGVDLETAIVIHAPVGTGTARLYSVDIRAGWDAALTSRWVRGWRKRKDLFREIQQVPEWEQEYLAIRYAATVDELHAVWQANKATWTDAHTAAAKARRAELEAVAS